MSAEREALPFTCGTCRWEGLAQGEYFAHCVAEQHDNWQAVRHHRVPPVACGYVDPFGGPCVLPQGHGRRHDDGTGQR